MSGGAPAALDAVSGTDVVQLYEQARVEQRVETATLPAWARRQYEAFDEKLLGERNDTAFPCHFGVEAQRNGGALYTFVPLNPDAEPVADGGSPTAAYGEAELAALADVLEAYLGTFEMHGPRTSLVTLFEPPSNRPGETAEAWDESAYRAAFWDVLQTLHDRDDAPWPGHIPTDPSHPQFEFCYAGDPMFVTGAAPFYDERASRFNPRGLEVTFQPRRVFAGITGDTDAGQRARAQIHDRIERHDDVPVHPHVGDWEDDDSHEWKQYLLPTGDETVADDACPLEVDPDVIGDGDGPGNAAAADGQRAEGTESPAERSGTASGGSR